MKKLNQKAKAGSALIIVILFMVLLVGLAVLILVKSVTSLQVSSNSVSSVKASDMAVSGANIVLADLKQEIIAGSSAIPTVPGAAPVAGTSTTYGTSPNTYTVYTPISSSGPSTSVPYITGLSLTTNKWPVIANGIETDGLANLVKISKYNVPFFDNTVNHNYANAGPMRASNVSSNQPALSGRLITPARWNSHFLLGRLTTGTGLNSTPVANFTAPDWVIVTRSGASVPYNTTDVTNLRNSASTNTEYAIGRFAYAVYDEGGTLDMNVAGYPSSLTALQAARKSSLAFADLTQLGLTQNQVDQIVGWRNPASAQLGASNSQFGSVLFGTTNGTNWLNNFVNYNYCQNNPTYCQNTALSSFGSKNGFMTVNTAIGATKGITAPSSGPQCDQMFVNRQQLISLMESLSIAPDILQYMGTFTRCSQGCSLWGHSR